MRVRHLVVLILAVAACSESEVAPEPAPKDDGPLNHRPVLVEIPDTSTTVGSVLYLTEGSDPDGDSLSYRGSVGSSLSDMRLGTMPVFHFDRSTHTLAFYPQAYDKPVRIAILWAEDGRGGVDTMTVRMAVN